MVRTAIFLVSAVCAAAAPTAAQTGARFPVVETTIADAHKAMRAGRLSARQLVQRYLDRIAAYDQAGPAVNSLITINPRALAIADSLDALYRRTGRLVGPLHGIPVIVKDNFDTYDLPTTAGSLSLAGPSPPDAAIRGRRIRGSGAIVHARTHHTAFARTPLSTECS